MATGPRKKFDDIFSRLDTQYTNVTDRRTDGQTPDDDKDRAYARYKVRKSTEMSEGHAVLRNIAVYVSAELKMSLYEFTRNGRYFGYHGPCCKPEVCKT